MNWDTQDKKLIESLNMLTSKPLVFVCNVEEESATDGNSLSKEVEVYAKNDGSECIIISAAIEAEITQLTSQEEKNEFLTTLGLEEAGLNLSLIHI